MSETEWTPKKIKAVRLLLDMSRTEFGHVLYADSTDDGVRSQVHKLESGDSSPSGGVRRVLSLLRKGMVDVAEEMLEMESLE
jgi:DNA-binding transcriptional regulator YiaG